MHAEPSNELATFAVLCRQPPVPHMDRQWCALCLAQTQSAPHSLVACANCGNRLHLCPTQVEADQWHRRLARGGR